MFITPDQYRKAFQEYLRKGTSLKLAMNAQRATPHYIWRTRNDAKVRPDHAANAGQIFAWDNPPPTGHPGEDYGCRCVAEPYVAEANEYIAITLADVSDTGSAWSSRDFVRHYYEGAGRGVTVRETGHLSSIAAVYLDVARAGLEENISQKARGVGNGEFSDYFNNTYDMTFTVFSLGDTTIGGQFWGQASTSQDEIEFSGSMEFYLKDAFADPLDIGVEAIDPGETIYENLLRPLNDHGRLRLGLPPTGPQRFGVQTGEPFPITDRWAGHFAGRIYADPSQGAFQLLKDRNQGTQ